jgi:hypothetical protein
MSTLVAIKARMAGRQAIAVNTSSTTVAAAMTDCDVATSAGIARTGPVGVRLLTRWLDFLLGRGERHQAAAPSPDEPSELYRCSIHEAAHCLIARLNNAPVLSVTTIPNPTLGYSGQALIGHGPPMARTMEEHVSHTREIVSTVGRHMPGHGEDPDDAAPWFLSVHKRVTELLAGAAGEIITFGHADDGRSRSDYNLAWLQARSICSSGVSTEPFLEFALAEAIELLRPYHPVLTALANELAARRELDGPDIDRIIAAALTQQDRDRELNRRKAWHDLTRRAKTFEEDRPQ